MLTPIQSFAALKAYDVKLSELANLFAIFCKQLQDLQDTPIFPEVERGLVRSLYIQGAAFFSSGFRIRAVVPFQSEGSFELATILTSPQRPGICGYS